MTDTLDKLVTDKGPMVDSDEDIVDIETYVVQRRKYERAIIMQEIDVMKWLRYVEIQRRKNNQVLEAKSTCFHVHKGKAPAEKNEYILSGILTARFSAFRSAGNGAVPCASKGSAFQSIRE